jgi:hypothetical protein
MSHSLAKSSSSSSSSSSVTTTTTTDKKNNVKVVIRVRPLLPQESEQSCSYLKATSNAIQFVFCFSPVCLSLARSV